MDIDRSFLKIEFETSFEEINIQTSTPFKKTVSKNSN
jgi:hypothetical protein